MPEIVDQRQNDTDMDPSGDDGAELIATGLICAACGTKLPPDSRFCNKCGAPIAPAATSAEYKQVRVLFADRGGHDLAKPRLRHSGMLISAAVR
jgi:predicted amidophosphoribosyltransferase